MTSTETLIQLVQALEEEGVTAQQDSVGALYTLAGLQELEKKGWTFTPPNPPHKP